MNQSEFFKKAILEAIESGKGTDWGYDEDSGNEYSFDTFNSECALEEVIRVIEENISAPWIPVEEKLPQEGEKVLVFGYLETELSGQEDERSTGLVLWESAKNSTCADTCYYHMAYNNITHWMPASSPN